MKKLLLFNDDIFEVGQRNIAPMTPSDVEKCTVNKVAGSGVDIYQICLLNGVVAAAQRSAFLDSYASHIEQPWKMYMWRMKKTIESLAEQNTDLLSVIAHRCREVGISPHASVRVNDFHHSFIVPESLKKSRHCKFRSDYYFPDLRCPWAESVKEMWLPGGTFNFAFAEIRNRKTDLIREVLEQHDIDGIDLDFTRNPPFFENGEKQQNMALMTEWIESIRLLVDRRAQQLGRPLSLTARFEYDHVKDEAEGLDIRQYIQKGLFDIICLGVIGDATPDASAKWWIDQCRGSGCKVCPGIEGHFYWVGLDIGSERPTSLENARAAASSYYLEGADGIQMFNFVADDQPWERAIVDELAYPERLAFADKEYVYTLWDGAVAVKRDPWESTLTLDNDRDQVSREFALGDDFNQARFLGREFAGELMLRIDGINRKEDLTFFWNGTVLNNVEPTEVRFVIDSFAVHTLRLQIPPEALRQGRNTLMIRRAIRYPDFYGHIEIQMAEVRIRYQKEIISTNMR